MIEISSKFSETYHFFLKTSSISLREKSNGICQIENSILSFGPPCIWIWRLNATFAINLLVLPDICQFVCSIYFGALSCTNLDLIEISANAKV